MFEDDDDTENTQEVYFLRLVPQSVLEATGRAAATGLHLVFNGPTAAGLDAWTLGQAWGWTREELAAMYARGDHLAGVLQKPGDRWGLASAEALSTLIAEARRADVGNATRTQILAAITCPPGLAAVRGLTRLRQQVAAVLDVPVGALARIPRRGDPVGDLPFLLDEKVDDAADDGLAPGSALPVTDYPDLATVVRLPWTRSPD